MKNLLVLVPMMLVQFFAFAQSRFDKIDIKINQVVDNIYMLEGSGGNIGVIVGEDGVLMIDSQFAPLSEKIKSAINSISGSGLKYLLNTHWHGDHTGGNSNFFAEGATIIAHDNVRARLSKDQFNKAFNRTTKAAPSTAWPVITFDQDIKVHFNGETIAMLHVHNAHTDGDAFVYFSNANVIHMGDTFFNGRFPYIDLGSGGSIEGMIAAVEKALMIIDDETIIIPGHGSLGSRADLKTYHEVITNVFKKVKKAVEEGHSLEEIKSAGYTTSFEGWGSGFISDERFIDIIWTDLNRE